MLARPDFVFSLGTLAARINYMPPEAKPSHPLRVVYLKNASGKIRANVDFSQWSLSIEGIPVERSDKTGTAKLFEAVSARAGRPSSAAAEMRKIIGVKKST